MKMGEMNVCSICASPLFEFSVEDPVRKALPANPDPLEDAVTPQLMEDQEGIHHTWENDRKASQNTTSRAVYLYNKRQSEHLQWCQLETFMCSGPEAAGFTWSLALVGDDAADKVRLSAAKVSHQLIKIFL